MSLDKKILEEVKRFNLMSGYSPKKTLSENLNEQATPGGVKQAAVDKILAISKNNNSKGKGSYLFSPQQSEIDKEFGQGTYDKFFNNGGQNILDNKKIEPKQEQKSTKPEIEIPSGVSQAAVDKILNFSKNNKSKLQGSYLFPPQQKEIDTEFGQGTYDKFYRGGGKNVLIGRSIFKTSGNVKNDLSKNNNTPKVNFIPEKFPLKYKMQGENVKKLQQVLDVRNKAGQPNITGKFYTATQLALNKKISELGLNYNEKEGLDQATFNDIVKPRNASQLVTGAPESNGVKTDLTSNIEAPQQIQTQAKNPEEYYNQLVSMKLIDSIEKGKNRIVYRGPVPAEDVQNTINDYLGKLGYSKTRKRDPLNKDKQVVVWKK
jgi:hypothetical protein